MGSYSIIRSVFVICYCPALDFFARALYHYKYIPLLLCLQEVFMAKLTMDKLTALAKGRGFVYPGS
ncbi:MAG TPA: hypothetical protein DHV31_00005, partial [Clostridiales bacterium]|nr:hypothetical protein [Clostridiales bacterium]